MNIIQLIIFITSNKIHQLLKFSFRNKILLLHASENYQTRLSFAIVSIYRSWDSFMNFSNSFFEICCSMKRALKEMWTMKERRGFWVLRQKREILWNNEVSKVLLSHKVLRYSSWNSTSPKVQWGFLTFAVLMDS